MEIGGVDVEVRSDYNVEETLYRAVCGVLGVWVEGLIQDSDTSKELKSTDLLGSGRREVFVYRDRGAMASWDASGWTEGNSRSMVHVLAYGDGVVTCVVEDSKDEELGRVLEAVRSGVTR